MRLASLRNPLGLLLSLTLTLPLWAQRPHLRFENFGMDRGLSQNFIQSLAQDQDGFLWIGTQDGVNRYDGYQFKAYASKPGQPPALPHNLVTSFAVTAQNQVWAGTYQGLAVYDRERDIFKPVFEGTPWATTQNEPINAMSPDLADGFWLSTPQYGLVHWDGQTFSTQGQPLLNDKPLEIHTFCVGPQGIWFNDLEGRLWFFDLKTAQFSQTQMPLPKTVTDPARVLLWHEGALLGVAGQTLFRFTPDSGAIETWFLSQLEPPEIGGVQLLAVDHWNRVWIASRKGLCRFDPKDGSNYQYTKTRDPESLSDNRVGALFVDATDNLWAGTFNGLSRLALDRPFHMFTADPDIPGALANPFIFGFAEDANGDLWVGTLDGLSHLKPGSDQFINYRAGDGSGLTSSWVRCIFRDPQDRLWIGHEKEGLSLWNPETETFSPIDWPNGPMSVLAMVSEAEGKLWLATLRGLFLFDSKTGEFSDAHKVEGGTRSENCFALARDRKGRLWGGFMGGLYEHLADDSLRRHLDGQSGTTVKTVLAIYPHPDGSLWLGSTEGLVHYEVETGTARVFSEADGLPNSLIYAIVPDPEGFLWVSTNRGLARMNLKDTHFTSYTVSQGLQNDEFNAGAAALLNSGELVFGGVNGFNRFYPGEVDFQHKHEPKTVFTDLLILNKVVNPSQEKNSPLQVALNETNDLVIQPNSGLVSIEFSSTHFAQPSEIQYAWLLEGLDERWVQTDASRRVATFTRLPAKDYSLRVKAGFHGLWGPERSLGIRVLPPPWLTPAAFVMYFVVGLSLIYAAFRLNSRKLRLEKARVIQFNQELEAQVKERTSQLENARQDLLEEAHLAGMAEIASNVLHSVGNTLNSVQASAYLLTQQYSGEKILDLLSHLNQRLEAEDWELMFTESARRHQFRDALLRLHQRMAQQQGHAAQEAEHLLARLSEALKMLQEQQTHAVPRDQYLTLQSLNQLVRVSLDKHGHLLREVRLNLELEEVPPVALDVTQMHRVLFYLLKNALEAIQAEAGQGVVTFKTGSERDEVVLTVADNGIGLPESTTRIYEMGYSTKSQGRGFGLHYCANAVHEMGGVIDLESAGPHKGCVVHLRFPKSRT